MSDDVSEDFSEIDVSSSDVESGGGGGGNYKNVPLLNYYQMTGLALQQLGLIIGVALMVGFLFMGMIGAEILWEKVAEKYEEKFGSPEKKDEEDPAALVGTFKRYK